MLRRSLPSKMFLLEVLKMEFSQTLELLTQMHTLILSWMHTQKAQHFNLEVPMQRLTQKHTQEAQHTQKVQCFNPKIPKPKHEVIMLMLAQSGKLLKQKLDQKIEVKNKLPALVFLILPRHPLAAVRAPRLRPRPRGSPWASIWVKLRRPCKSSQDHHILSMLEPKDQTSKMIQTLKMP